MEEKIKLTDSETVLDAEPERTQGPSQEELYRIIFSDCHTPIRKLILYSGGMEQDVDDVLHDTFVLVSTSMAAATLKKAESVPAFLTCVARGIWISEMRRRQCKEFYEAQLTDSLVDDESEWINMKHRCYRLYWTHFKNLNDICRKLITSALRKTDSKKVQDRLGMSHDFYYKKKSNCLKMLLQQIKKDPNYNRIMISQ